MPAAWDHLLTLARSEVRRTTQALPPPLREAAIALPVTFESVPSPAYINDGIEADTLGLFVGPDFADQNSTSVPSQIVLYLDNISEMVDHDPDDFRAEVRTTYLHELGHYLGLDENDLDDRGLG